VATRPKENTLVERVGEGVPYLDRDWNLWEFQKKCRLELDVSIYNMICIDVHCSGIVPTIQIVLASLFEF
jgi:hypothetical protein